MTQPRNDTMSIWNAGVDAVRARTLVQDVVHVSADRLSIGHRKSVDQATFLLSDFDQIILVGGGKAATAMALGFCEAIDGRLPIRGWINVPGGTEQSIANVTVHPARPAGLNEPTAAGVEGSKQMVELVENAGARDLCVTLISGGGSALMPLPATGISLQDKQSVTRFLSSAGANIGQLNTVRKHLSQIKGGGLLAVKGNSSLVSLVLSDVLGDPLDLIASGPTVVDSSTPDDALAVLAEFDPSRELPSSIYQVLNAASTHSRLPESSSGNESQTIVIGNNQLAVDRAAERARELGYTVQTESASSCEGTAESVANRLTDRFVSILRDKNAPPTCLISGGEPTVKLADESVRGRGGRNQQLVLAAFQRLQELGLSEDEWKRVAFLSGGTDGEDGPTDAAGGVVDAQTRDRILSQEIAIQDHLDRNDAYSALQQCDGLLMTGPTGTNVCDVRVFLIRPVQG